jgi:hypothetical protein
VRDVFEWIGRWLFGAIALGSGLFSLFMEGMGLYMGRPPNPLQHCRFGEVRRKHSKGA